MIILLLLQLGDDGVAAPNWTPEAGIITAWIEEISSSDNWTEEVPT